MIAFLLGLLSPLGGFFANILKALGPPQSVIEAEKAGSAESALKTAEAHNDEVQQVADAGHAVDAAIASDDGLRKFEQSDPNNRANSR